MCDSYIIPRRGLKLKLKTNKMIFEHSEAPLGKFVNKSLLKTGMICTICSEAVSRPGNPKFADPKTGVVKDQVVAKIIVEGIEGEFNFSINYQTVAGLIHAFGKESKNWQGHKLTMDVKDGVNGISVFLLPENYKLVREKNGDKTYLKVTKATPEVTT
jgi:hypothetical protein